MSRAFCRLSSPWHFPESNRGLIYRQRNCGRLGGSADFAFPPEATNYLFKAGAFCIAGGIAGIPAAGSGSGANTFLAESGSLFAFATSNASCQTCVSFNMSLKVGIPVKRIPFFTFQ
jgi:hypothetical protein